MEIISLHFSTNPDVIKQRREPIIVTNTDTIKFFLCLTIAMIILGMCQTYPKYIYCFSDAKIECQITNNKYGTEFQQKYPKQMQ